LDGHIDIDDDIDDDILYWPMRSHCAIHRVYRAALGFSLRTSRPDFCERLGKVLVSVRLEWVRRPDQETHKYRVAKAWNGPIYLIENMSGYRNFAIVGAGTLGNYIIRQFLKEKAAGTVKEVVVLTRQVSSITTQ